MPLSAAAKTQSYNTMIFGTFYHYTHRMIYQQFESIYCPIISVLLLTISMLILRFKKTNPVPAAKLFLAAGMGPLGFGLFRTILTSLYSHNLVWFNAWEELTELLFILGVCAILWIFKSSLLANHGKG